MRIDLVPPITTYRLIKAIFIKGNCLLLRLFAFSGNKV